MLERLWAPFDFFYSSSFPGFGKVFFSYSKLSKFSSPTTLVSLALAFPVEKLLLFTALLKYVPLREYPLHLGLFRGIFCVFAEILSCSFLLPRLRHSQENIFFATFFRFHFCFFFFYPRLNFFLPLLDSHFAVPSSNPVLPTFLFS